MNTGWTGGSYGKGERMKLAQTRAIIDAIHSGELEEIETVQEPCFGLEIPTSCPGCPSEILDARRTWDDERAYEETARKLARLFEENMASIDK